MSVSTPNDYKRLEEIYSLFRKYIEQENNLINNRMTWLMTVQSFLIATFGFSYQKEFEVLTEIHLSDKATEVLNLADISLLIHNYKYFLAILASIGIFTSLVATLSIMAAFMAIDNITEKWNEDFLQNDNKLEYLFQEKPKVDFLPGIAGGGNTHASIWGKWLALALPAFFFIFWTSVFIFVIAKKFQILQIDL